MRSSTFQILAGAALLALLAGCGARQNHASSAAGGQTRTPGVAPGPVSQTALAQVLPKEIDRLTDQLIVYECPTCKRMYATGGACPRDGASMFPVKISYFCPYDGQLAFHRGRCPKCGRVLKIEKAMILPGGVRTEEVN